MIILYFNECSKGLYVYYMTVVTVINSGSCLGLTKKKMERIQNDFFIGKNDLEIRNKRAFPNFFWYEHCPT